MRKILAAALAALALSLASWPALAAPCAPTPALADVERRAEYTGIVAQTGPFNLNFQLYGDGVDYSNWIEVWVNGNRLVGTTDYIVTSPSGPLANLCRPISDAQVTFTAAQTGTIEILGARRPRRASQVSENAGVQARAFNQVVSDMEAQLRERWDLTGRLVRSPPGETLAVLPTAASRANKFLRFDSTGLIPQVALGAGSGNVVGPLTSVVGNLAGWGNADGTLLTDSGVSFKNGRPWADVRAWGAVGDGVTDDTAAFTAAINAVSSSFFWGGTVFVPPGNGGNPYCIKSGITLGRGMRLLGAGMPSSNLSSCGANTTVVTLTGLQSTVEYMTLTGTGSDGATAFGASNPTLMIANTSVSCIINHVKSFGGYNAISHNGADCIFTDFQSNQYYGDSQCLIRGSGWVYRFVCDNGGTGVNLPTPPFTVSAWQATHAYTLGQAASLACAPSCPSGVTAYYIQVTTAGTSAGSAPALKNYGVNITDGTVTWKLLTPVGGAAMRVDTGSVEWRGSVVDMSGPNDYGLAITNTLAGAAPSFINLSTIVIGSAFQNGIYASDGSNLTIDKADLGGCMLTSCTTFSLNTNWAGAATIVNSHFLDTLGIDYQINQTTSANGLIVANNTIAGAAQAAVKVANLANSITWTGNQVTGGTSGFQIEGATHDFYTIANNTCRSISGTCVIDAGTGTNKSTASNNGLTTGGSFTNPTLVVAQPGSALLNDNAFAIRDHLDTSKIGQFVTSGITTATTRTYTLPNANGTFAVGASAPLALNATSGNLTVTGAAGQVLAGATPAFTATPVLGVAGSTVGTLSFENATSGRVTLQPPAGAMGTLTPTLPNNSGTIVTTVNKLNVFAATTSSELASVISDETGSGAAVFGTSPTIATPTFTGSITATGLVKNADLVNPATTVAGSTCTLGSTCGLSSVTNSLGADVLMNNTANYFDGPSVAQGASGTWFASGTVTMLDTGTAPLIYCKLWDGTNIIATSGLGGYGSPNTLLSMTLSGKSVANPPGNIRISCRDVSAITGKILFNTTGNSSDSTLSAFRIN